jgi:hypothetical protein
MQCAARSLVLALLGLSISCFNSSKTTNVPSSGSECLAFGAACHASADCCTQSCDDHVCAEKK